jgi:hypothetical protein
MSMVLEYQRDSVRSSERRIMGRGHSPNHHDVQVKTNFFKAAQSSHPPRPPVLFGSHSFRIESADGQANKAAVVGRLTGET